MGAGPEMLLPYLGAAARDARERAGRLQVHVAAELDVRESTIRNFETGKHWPTNPDRTVGGYASDLGVDPLEIWEEALRRWRADR